MRLGSRTKATLDEQCGNNAIKIPCVAVWNDEQAVDSSDGTMSNGMSSLRSPARAKRESAETLLTGGNQLKTKQANRNPTLEPASFRGAMYDRNPDSPEDEGVLIQHPPNSWLSSQYIEDGKIVLRWETEREVQASWSKKIPQVVQELSL